MSYTFEENSARLTDTFHGIAKRTMDEVREEIAKANRTWSPARISEAVANDPRITNILRAERVMKEPRAVPNVDHIAAVYKRFGDAKQYTGRRASTNESARLGSPRRDTRVSEATGQVLSPRVGFEPDADDLPPNATDSYKQLMRMAAEHKAAFPHLSKEQSMADVIRTPKGKALYEKDRASRLSGGQAGAGGFGY